MLCAVLSVCMGVLGTASRPAGRALGATHVHCAGLGMLSAGSTHELYGLRYVFPGLRILDALRIFGQSQCTAIL